MTSRCWVFGDNIDTDQILPSQYMLLSVQEMNGHAMEPKNPDFAKECQVGDYLVAGHNFGCGSSREQAPLVLKNLGIKAVIACSFARIFYRNAINLGLPLIELSDAKSIEEGDSLEVDIETGKMVNLSKGQEFLFAPIVGLPKKIIDAGGLIPMIRKEQANIIKTDNI